MDEILPRQVMCGWGVWRKGHMWPVSLYSHPCWWRGEEPPCTGRWTGGLYASAHHRGALGQRPSRYAPLSPISDLLVSDKKLSLLCLMTEPRITPSTTSPWNVIGTGVFPWHWRPPSCDGGQQWKTLACHPGKKGPKQLWLCPHDKNGCGCRSNISILTGFMILRSECQV